MNYDETCRAIGKVLDENFYRAMNIDYDYRKRGAGRYSVSAKGPAGIRVVIAYTGSYTELLTETKAYFL